MASTPDPTPAVPPVVAPRTRRGSAILGGAAVAVCTLGAVALALALEHDDARMRDAAPVPLATPYTADGSPCPTLEFAPRALVAGRPRPEAAEPAPSDLGSPASPAPASAAPDFLALAPGAVADVVSPGALAPFPIPRAWLVGEVGPYGARDGGGRPCWSGVARIERDDAFLATAPSAKEPPPTTALRGRVAGEDGRAIAGAEVIVYTAFYVRQAYYDHRVQQIGRVLTDADGVFDLRPIALDTIHFGRGGEVLVTVRHPVVADLVAARVPAIVPGQETDAGVLVLPERGARVHGRVRDLEGRPVAGAVVRVSGAFVPTSYDKTERMIVLDACPAAVTDTNGLYELTDFASGDHDISIHIRIDCVEHGPMRIAGEVEWSPQVQAGNAVRGRVLDPDGAPVAAAVVAGGGNWTPTLPDGTFWLDNVLAGPLTLEVVHHDWHTVRIANVPTNGDDVTLREVAPLPRVTFTVVDSEGASVPLVAIDWVWPPGGGPGPFAVQSRYFHDARGVFALIVPEGAVGATVSGPNGATGALRAEDLADGARRTVTLAKKASGG